MLPNPRQKTAEHDGVSQPLLEMDKQVFVVNGFTAPERFCMVLFAGVGLKAVLEVGPTLFELALQQQDLRPIPAGGRVFWMALDD